MKQSFMILSYTRNDKQVKEIDKFLDLLERSGVCKVIENHFKTEKTADKGGRPNYNPYNMLAMILYSFAFSFASLREIEDRCVNNLRYVYIMDGEKPAFKTIGNFINQAILPNIDKIFSLITLQIIKDCNLNFDTVFIDGSKFEAKANRYKFVWKPTTFHKAFFIKIGVAESVPIAVGEPKRYYGDEKVFNLKSEKSNASYVEVLLNIDINQTIEKENLLYYHIVPGERNSNTSTKDYKFNKYNNGIVPVYSFKFQNPEDNIRFVNTEAIKGAINNAHSNVLNTRTWSEEFIRTNLANSTKKYAQTTDDKPISICDPYDAYINSGFE